MKITKFCFGILLAALLIFSLNSNSWADLEGYKKITAPEVKEMIDEGRCVLIHVLSKIEYDMQHISGSINIPITTMQSTTTLPKDKNTPIIFYCMGLR